MSTSSPKERLIGTRGLYLVLTSPAIPHLELAAGACERGVQILQLREKDLPDEELVKLAREIADITGNTDTLFIINENESLRHSCLHHDGGKVAGLQVFLPSWGKSPVQLGCRIFGQTHNLFDHELERP